MYVSNFFLFVKHARNVSILDVHSRHSRNKRKILIVILIQLLVILQILFIDLVCCLLPCFSSRLLTILNLSSTLPKSIDVLCSGVFSSLLSSLSSHPTEPPDTEIFLECFLTVVILSLLVLLHLCF